MVRYIYNSKVKKAKSDGTIIPQSVIIEGMYKIDDVGNFVVAEENPKLEKWVKEGLIRKEAVTLGEKLNQEISLDSDNVEVIEDEQDDYINPLDEIMDNITDDDLEEDETEVIDLDSIVDNEKEEEDDEEVDDEFDSLDEKEEDDLNITDEIDENKNLINLDDEEDLNVLLDEEEEKPKKVKKKKAVKKTFSKVKLKAKKKTTKKVTRKKITKKKTKKKK